jgi:RNA-directed DNA polymerase
LLVIHRPQMLAETLGYSLTEIEEVIETTNKHSRKYYYSYIDKKIKNGKIKLRPIDPSRDRLRDIQNKIQGKILSKIPMPQHLKGSIKGRNNIENVKYHRGNNFNFQMDLTNFFGFVTNNMVFTMLRSLNFSPTVARLITKLTTYKGHLPQGVPTSPTLANLVGLNFDMPILELCKKNNIKYTRYVDDLWFSANHSFKEVEKEILEIIGNYDFLFSHNKTVNKVGKIEGTGCLKKTNGKLGIMKKHEENLLILIYRHSQNRD